MTVFTAREWLVIAWQTVEPFLHDTLLFLIGYWAAGGFDWVRKQRRSRKGATA